MSMALVAMLLSFSRMAHAEEIEAGRTKPFGLGIAAGFPPSASLKIHADQRNTVVFHVGPTMTTSGLHVRAQYEQEAAELRAWDIGRLAFLWHVGVEANLIFGQASSVRPGIFAGVGVEFQLVPAPVVLFAEAAPVVYPRDLVLSTQFLPVGLHLTGGGRFYFGKRRVR